MNSHFFDTSFSRLDIDTSKIFNETIESYHFSRSGIGNHDTNLQNRIDALKEKTQQLWADNRQKVPASGLLELIDDASELLEMDVPSSQRNLISPLVWGLSRFLRHTAGNETRSAAEKLVDLWSEWKIQDLAALARGIKESGMAANHKSALLSRLVLATRQYGEPQGQCEMEALAPALCAHNDKDAVKNWIAIAKKYDSCRIPPTWATQFAAFSESDRTWLFKGFIEQLTKNKTAHTPSRLLTILTHSLTLLPTEQRCSAFFRVAKLASDAKDIVSLTNLATTLETVPPDEREEAYMLGSQAAIKMQDATLISIWIGRFKDAPLHRMREIFYDFIQTAYQLNNPSLVSALVKIEKHFPPEDRGEMRQALITAAVELNAKEALDPLIKELQSTRKTAELNKAKPLQKK